jgi:hypothetical protein
MSSTYTQPFVFSNIDTTIDPETEITTSVTTKETLLDFRGIELKYDLTSTPKQFSISDGGINFRDGTNNYTTGLERLALVQTAFQAVELPPNATTLKLNDTIVLDNGSAITNTINNYQTQLVESSVGSVNQIFQEVSAGGANFILNSANLSVPSSHSVRMEVPNGGNAIIEHIELGTSNTKNLAISSTGNLTLAGDNVALTSTALSLTSSAVGGIANPPQFVLQNTNAVGAVVMEVYKDKPTAGVNGDVLFTQRAFGKDSSNAKQEFTRITHTIRDITAGAEDGSIEMGCMVNGSFANFLQINGNQNEVNCLKPLDMDGHNIRTSTGDMTIDTTGSSGAGDINITGKSGSIMSLSATLMNITSNGGANINLNANTGVVAGVGSALTFNTINILPRKLYSSLAFSVSGSPTGTILNFGSLADMVATTTWKVDVGFYTGAINTRNVITYWALDTTSTDRVANSVFGYADGGLQTAIQYDPAGTPMGTYCSFTDTFSINSIATGACSFILTGGTSDGSTWSGTARVSIVLTRLS